MPPFRLVSYLPALPTDRGAEIEALSPLITHKLSYGNFQVYTNARMGRPRTEVDGSHPAVLGLGQKAWHPRILPTWRRRN